MLKESMVVVVENGPKFYEQKEITFCYEVFRPAGNDTALVEGIIENSRIRQEVAQQIMNVNPNIEQVGFYDLSDPENPTLMMAGKELCGNALRSFMYYIFLLSGGKIREARIRVRMENMDVFLRAGVDGFQRAWAEMPIKKEKIKKSETVSDLNDLYSLGIQEVALEGITHLVTALPSEIAAIADKTQQEIALKTLALSLLQERGLDQSVPAAGVMFLSWDQGKLLSLPVVLVPESQTFFLETACSTGTTAIGIVLARFLGRTINQEVLQPSGQTILVQVLVEEFIQEAKISGPVQRITRKITTLQ